MTAFDRAQSAIEATGEPWWPAVTSLMVHGWVVSTPRLFVAGWRCDPEAGELAGDYWRWTEDRGDAWFVWVAATRDGRASVGDILDAAPHPLPWVGWSRRGSPIRWRRWPDIARASRKKRLPVVTGSA